MPLKIISRLQELGWQVDNSFKLRDLHNGNSGLTVSVPAGSDTAVDRVETVEWK